MSAEDKRARVEELLRMASEQTEAAEQALDQALGLDSVARDDLLSARDLADSAGYPAEALIEPEPLLNVAEARVGLASQKVSRPGKSRSRDDIRRRVAASRAKIQALREELIG
jgi:hypothetical protein